MCDVDWCYVRDLKQIIRFYLQSKIFQDRYHQQQRLEFMRSSIGTFQIHGGGSISIVLLQSLYNTYLDQGLNHLLH